MLLDRCLCAGKCFCWYRYSSEAWGAVWLRGRNEGSIIWIEGPSEGLSGVRLNPRLG